MSRQMLVLVSFVLLLMAVSGSPVAARRTSGRRRPPRARKFVVVFSLIPPFQYPFSTFLTNHHVPTYICYLFIWRFLSLPATYFKTFSSSLCRMAPWHELLPYFHKPCRNPNTLPSARTSDEDVFHPRAQRHIFHPDLSQPLAVAIHPPLHCGNPGRTNALCSLVKTVQPGHWIVFETV